MKKTILLTLIVFLQSSPCYSMSKLAQGNPKKGHRPKSRQYRDQAPKQNQSSLAHRQYPAETSKEKEIALRAFNELRAITGHDQTPKNVSSAASRSSHNLDHIAGHDGFINYRTSSPFEENDRIPQHTIKKAFFYSGALLAAGAIYCQVYRGTLMKPIDIQLH